VLTPAEKGHLERLAKSTGHAPLVAQVVTSVAIRVLLEIVLVVPLCRIERDRWNDLSDHLGRPLARAIHLGLHAFCDDALFVAVVKIAERY